MTITLRQVIMTAFFLTILGVSSLLDDPNGLVPTALAQSTASEASASQTTSFFGRIIDVTEGTPTKYPDGSTTITKEYRVKLDDSADTVSVSVERLSTDMAFGYQYGDRVILNRQVDFAGNEVYYLADHVRTPSLTGILLLFIVLVITVAGWHGVRSLLGLASSYLIIFGALLPLLDQGYNPILVTILGAVGIMLFTFYLSHGFTSKTTIAVVGTLISLIATGILAALFSNLAKLTGFASEEAAFLQITQGPAFNARGIMLAGIIIGALGILDDITISQASIVQELRSANPDLSPQQLFFKAMNVGKDHIASLVNTLILVYTGSSLPLLMLFQNSNINNAALLLNYEIIAEEVVRTVVGSIGLVLAVPITTALASYIKVEVEPWEKGKKKKLHVH